MEHSQVKSKAGDLGEVCLEVSNQCDEETPQQDNTSQKPTSTLHSSDSPEVEPQFDVISGRQLQSGGTKDLELKDLTEEGKERDNLNKIEFNKHPITLTFKELSYSVSVKKKKSKHFQKAPRERRELLRGISGICRPSELTAIMGASGAGKTTLLNLLSVRLSSKKGNILKGEFLANNKKYDIHLFCKFAGYVMQNDILLETMTPREVFQFTANLRLHLPAAEKKRKVDQLLSDLKLERAADTYVGGTFHKGISGGERKRTSIGMELMTNPNLLLLDEPTSGLDSFTAFLLITLLKNLATREGKTIVFTIHQPSSDIFFMFDSLMILAKGKFIYQGPTKPALEHFSRIGYKCPDYSNPADYYIEVAHSNRDDDEKFSVMYEAYNQNLAPKIQQEINALEKTPIALAEKVNSWCLSCRYIAKRSFLNMLRNPILLKGRIAQTAFITFLFCVLYFQVTSEMSGTDPTTPENMQVLYDINGGLFFFSITMFMPNAMSVVLTFPAERAVFLREHSANMYGVSAYYFGRSTTEIPFVVMFPVIMTSISYYIVGFNPEVSKFFIFMLISVLVALAGNAIGLFVGCCFSDTKVATNIVPMIFLPWMIFTGVYINSQEIPAWLRWFQYTSPFRYAYEAYLWNQYTDFPLGTAQLDYYGYSLGLWPCIGLLFAIGIIIRIAALCALKVLVRRLQ